MILVVIPHNADPDKNVEVTRRVIMKLIDRIRSVVCVAASRADEDACSTILAACKKIGPEISIISVDDIEKITVYSEVYLLPLGMKSLIAVVAYNLGKAGTNLKLVSASKKSVRIASGKTMRVIETI